MPSDDRTTAVSAVTSARQWVAVLLTAALVVAVYAWASWSNGFVFDDFTMIREQKVVHSPVDLITIFSEHDGTAVPYFRPVTRTTLAVQKALHGDAPRAFHVFNAVLCGLTFIAAYALIRRPGFAVAHGPALLAALLFVAHPVISSCVYPAASGRETLLPAFFMLASLWAYLHAGAAWCVLAMALYVAGQLSKELAIVLPAAFFLADQLRLADAQRTWKQRLARYIPLALLVVFYLTIRHFLYSGQEFHLAVVQNPLGPVWSYLYGIQTVILPDVQLRYEPPVQVWLDTPRLVAALFVMLLVIVAVWRERARAGRAALFWLAWFVLVQLPTARILQQEAVHDERYVSLAVLALFAVVAALITPAWSKFRSRLIITLSALVLVVVSFSISVGRSRYFADQGAFMSQWVATNDASAGGHQGLGKWYADQQDHERALHHFERAIEIRSDFGEAYNNKGSALMALKRVREAAEAFEQAVRLLPNSPSAHGNMATAHSRLSQFDKAFDHYRKAMELSGDDPQLFYNIGSTSKLAGNWAQAAEYYQRAINLNPQLAIAHAGLADVMTQQQRLDDAITHYRRAVEIDSQIVEPEQYFNFGLSLLLRRQVSESLTQFDQALRRKPGYTQAHYFRGVALAQMQRLPDAAQSFEQVLRIEPGNIDARVQLATLAAVQGDIATCVQQFEAAYTVAPDRPDILVGYAWVLATTQDQRYGDGEKAVQLAQRAMQRTAGKDPASYDAAAAGYARMGQFDRAATLTDQAIALLRSAGDHDYAARIAQRQRMYQAGQPYIQPGRIGPQ